MQEIIEGLIRGLGRAFLQLLSLGRHRSADEVTEGAIGFALVLAVMAATYWWTA